MTAEIRQGGRDPGTRHRRRTWVLGCVVLLAGCSASATLDTAGTSTASVDASDGVGAPATATVSTEASFAETPVPTSTATPPPAPTPAPTPRPTASTDGSTETEASPSDSDAPGPTPLAVVEADGQSAPIEVAAGEVRVPVVGLSSFELREPRPVLQFEGHSLVYLDLNRRAEVDIFVPVANGRGALLTDYDAVIAEFLDDPAYAAMTELAPTTVSGFAARVFDGQPTTGARGFFTAASNRTQETAGWFPPAQLRIWFVDLPANTVAITAESFSDNPAEFEQAVALAEQVRSTIRFGLSG